MIEILQTPGGLAVLHLVQAILFAAMVYVLGTEYVRTLNPDLVYKLIASFSIATLNIMSAGLLYLEQFESMKLTDAYYPLIHNCVFVIIVLALARAFIYDCVSNKELFDRIYNWNIVLLIVTYFIFQLYWLQIYEPGMLFSKSSLQLVFSMYFIALLVVLTYITLRYRTKFQNRIAIAFVAIIVVQLITMLDYALDEIAGGLKVMRAIAPVAIPAMFGSVVFKELIANNEKMLEDLRQVFHAQGGMIKEMDDMCMELGKLAGQITQKSSDSWERLLSIKTLAEGMPERNTIILEKIRHQSRDIETMAGQADALNIVIDRIQTKNHDLSIQSEVISYVNT